MQVLFCDLHSAVVLADIVQSSRRKYRPCVTDFVGRFCPATKPRPQKSADFVVRLTSPFVYQVLVSTVMVLIKKVN